MADTVKQFQISRPKNVKFTMHGAGGKVTCQLEWNRNMPGNRGQNFRDAQKFVDKACIERMREDTPFRTGMLRMSATTGTVAGSGIVRQTEPYSRRQYFEHARKAKWFEVMKNRDRDVILEGARKIVTGSR